ncbi:MAG: cysteine synthase family protein [Bacteroidota bacterium]|nr:cysteine synthase family protein [Bacteroidota bacterium]
MSDLLTTAIPGFREKLTALQSQIGNTPLFEVRQLFRKKNVSLYAKQEWAQLSGSVKARAAYAIFRDAIYKGLLGNGKTLLDATSGNTGIAYAWLGKALGIPVTLCLPENASEERKEILKSLGAGLILTSRFEGTDGAQELARSLAENDPERYFYADQYKNDNNWKAHYYGTAVEIIEKVPGITHFVAGLGTTGTFVGTGRRLKKYNPQIQVISLQPDNPLHGLEGWKHLETAVVPQIYDPGLADRNLEIGTEESWQMIREARDKEGLILSPSSAANLAGAIRVASGLDEGIVVTVLPDNGDKYGEILKKILR